MKYLSILSVLLLIGGNFSFAMEDDTKEVDENVNPTQKLMEDDTKEVDENVNPTQKPNKTRLQEKIEKIRMIRREETEEESKKEESKENELEKELNITKKKINNSDAIKRHEKVMQRLRQTREKLRNRIQKMYKQGKVSKELKDFYDDKIDESYTNRRIFSDITKEIDELDEKQNTEEELKTKSDEDTKVDSMIKNRKAKLKMKLNGKKTKLKNEDSNSDGNNTESSSTTKLPIVNNTDELKNRNPHYNLMVFNNNNDNDNMEDIKIEDLGNKYYDNEGSHEHSEFKNIDEM